MTESNRQARFPHPTSNSRGSRLLTPQSPLPATAMQPNWSDPSESEANALLLTLPDTGFDIAAACEHMHTTHHTHNITHTTPTYATPSTHAYTHTAPTSHWRGRWAHRAGTEADLWLGSIHSAQPPGSCVPCPLPPLIWHSISSHCSGVILRNSTGTKHPGDDRDTYPGNLCRPQVNRKQGLRGSPGSPTSEAPGNEGSGGLVTRPLWGGWLSPRAPRHQYHLWAGPRWHQHSSAILTPT